MSHVAADKGDMYSQQTDNSDLLNVSFVTQSGGVQTLYRVLMIGTSLCTQGFGLCADGYTWIQTFNWRQERAQGLWVCPYASGYFGHFDYRMLVSIVTQQTGSCDSFILRVPRKYDSLGPIRRLSFRRIFYVIAHAVDMQRFEGEPVSFQKRG